MIGQEIWDEKRTTKSEQISQEQWAMQTYKFLASAPVFGIGDPTGRAPIDYSAITRDLS